MTYACTILFWLDGFWALNSQILLVRHPWSRPSVETVQMGGSFIDLAAPLDTAGAYFKTCIEMKQGSMERMDFVVFELGTRCHRCPTSVSCRSVMAANRVVKLAPVRSPLLSLTKSTSDNAQNDTIMRLLVQLVRFQCAGDTKTFDVHDDNTLEHISTIVDFFPFSGVKVDPLRLGYISKGEDTGKEPTSASRKEASSGGNNWFCKPTAGVRIGDG